jgi:O-antigen/teichoic acid export membrane protein
MDSATAPEAYHRATRDARLKWAVMSAVFVRPLAVLIPILIVPLFVRYLGNERYGLFESISALAVWIGLTNMGLGFGLTNRLVDCHVSGDTELARRYVSTLFTSTLGILCIALAVVLGLVLYVNWRDLLHASAQVSPVEVQYAVCVALIIPLVSVTTSYAPSVYSAYQETHHQNLWDGVGKVTTVLACLVLPHTRLGIAGAIFALSGTPVIIALTNQAWLWFYLKPWLRPSLRYFDRRLLANLLHDGILLFVLQSSAMLLFQADRVVISFLRSPEEVAQFAIVNRLFLLAYGAFYLVLAPLWPAYGEAFRRGDVKWCQRKLWLSICLGLACVVSMGLCLLVVGNHVILLLTGQSTFAVSRWLIIAMTVGCCFRVWGDCYAILLSGANLLREQLWVMGTAATIAIVSNVLLTRQFGIIGTAWSYPVAGAAIVWWAYPFIWVRHRRKRQMLGRANQVNEVQTCSRPN